MPTAVFRYNAGAGKFMMTEHPLTIGLVDYLEVMQIAGVSDWVPLSTNRKETAAERPVSGQTAPPRPPEPQKPSEPPEPETMPKTLVLPKELTGKADLLRWLADKTTRCKRCKELAANRTQTVFGTGNPEAKLLFLGEAPGADEDKQGEPFVGRAGQLLTDIITKGMKLRREDVYICNILRCRPPGNRNPLPDEAEHCRPFLDLTLEVIKPKFICCLGAVAAKNLLATEQPIGSLRGKVLEHNGITVICTYHPAYLLRNPAAKKDTWGDIQILMQEMEKK